MPHLNLSNILSCLKEFSEESGLQVNLKKSKIWISPKARSHLKASLVTCNKFTLSENLVSYLGVLMIHGKATKKLIEMDKTEYTDVLGRARWPGATQRVLHTPFFYDWIDFPDGENELSQPVIGHTTIHGKEREVRRMAGTVPNASTTGDIESMGMYAGEGVGIIKEILPAGEVIERLVDGAQLLIQQKFQAHHI